MLELLHPAAMARARPFSHRCVAPEAQDRKLARLMEQALSGRLHAWNQKRRDDGLFGRYLVDPMVQRTCARELESLEQVLKFFGVRTHEILGEPTRWPPMLFWASQVDAEHRSTNHSVGGELLGGGKVSTPGSSIHEQQNKKAARLREEGKHHR